MAKDPAFLFYPSDFLTGTYTMSNDEVGAYIKLLCIQHSNGYLTEYEITKICGNTDQSNVRSKFSKDEATGHFANLRLQMETKKRKEYSRSRSENRKAGAKSTEIKNYIIDTLKICKSYDFHMENINKVIDYILKNKDNYTLYSSDIKKFTQEVRAKILEYVPNFNFDVIAENIIDTDFAEVESIKAQQILDAEDREKFFELALKSGYKLPILFIIVAKRVTQKSGLKYFVTDSEKKHAAKLAAILKKKHDTTRKCLEIVIDALLNMKGDDFWKDKVNLAAMTKNLNQVLNLKH